MNILMFIVMTLTTMINGVKLIKKTKVNQRRLLNLKNIMKKD